VVNQPRVAVTSPTAEHSLDLNVSTVIAKSASDTQEQQFSAPNQPVDDIRNDQSSIESAPCEKRPDSFYPRDDELTTGMCVQQTVV